MPESVVIIDVPVAPAQSEDALLEQVGEGVFDEGGVAVVAETGREAVEEAELHIDFAEEEGSGVGGDATAVNGGEDIARAEVLEGEGAGGHSVRPGPLSVRDVSAWCYKHLPRPERSGSSNR